MCFIRLSLETRTLCLRPAVYGIRKTLKSLVFVFVLLAILAHLENSSFGGMPDMETILVVPDLGGAADVDVSAGPRHGPAGFEVFVLAKH